jgi:phage terminase large subunit-like protein
VAAWASEHGAETVREFPTQRAYRMAPAVSSLHTAIVMRELEHDGDPRVARHVANARRAPTRYGTSVRKDQPRSPRKIDAVAAAALAFQARTDAIAANLDRKRGRRRSGKLLTF